MSHLSNDQLSPFVPKFKICEHSVLLGRVLVDAEVYSIDCETRANLQAVYNFWVTGIRNKFGSAWEKEAVSRISIFMLSSRY